MSNVHLGPVAGTTLRVVGKCRGCDKEHDGPLFYGIRFYPDMGACLTIGTVEDEAFHCMTTIPLKELNHMLLDTIIEGL